MLWKGLTFLKARKLGDTMSMHSERLLWRGKEASRLEADVTHERKSSARRHSSSGPRRSYLRSVRRRLSRTRRTYGVNTQSYGGLPTASESSGAPMDPALRIRGN